VPVRTPGNGLGHAARAALRSLTHPLVALRSGASAVPHLDQVPMMRTLPGAAPAARAARAALRVAGRGGGAPTELPEAPRLRFNGPLSPRRSVAFGHVELDTVRELKAAHGVSFNDVVLAGVAGGMRRRLLDTGELPEGPLLAFVPANVRTADHHRTQGNAISSFVVPIPTDLPDAADRVRTASRSMLAAKERHMLTPPTLMDDANAMIPPVAFGALAGGMLRLLGSGLVAPPLNLLISNVPGPPVRVYLDGAPMEAFSPMSVVFGGAALNVTVISYAGRLEIGVVGDAELVPDAPELVAAIEAEFAAMAAEL
jgi:WS/DGAT/MGAT family acyltransferase